MPEARKGCCSRGGERGMESIIRGRGERGGGKLRIFHCSNHRCFFNALLCREVMRKWGGFFFFFSLSSSSSSSSLQDSGALSRFLSVLDKANFISTLQHMVPPSLQHACRRAHKRPLSQYIPPELLQDSSKIKVAVKEGCRGTRNSWSGIRAAVTRRRRWKSGLFYHIHTEPHFHIWWERTRLPCL